VEVEHRERVAAAGPKRKLQVMLIQPSRLVRAALAVFGVIFLPVAIGFLVIDARRNWLSAAAMFLVSGVFLFLAFDRRDNSLLSALDDSADK
jgi:hypothetical protein